MRCVKYTTAQNQQQSGGWCLLEAGMRREEELLFKGNRDSVWEDETSSECGDGAT